MPRLISFRARLAEFNREVPWSIRTRHVRSDVQIVAETQMWFGICRYSGCLGALFARRDQPTEEIPMKPIRTFKVRPALPPLLLPLLGIAHNLRWSWDHAAIELFRRLDRDLWETSGHNPVLLLGSVDQVALEAVASDDSFLAHMRRVAETLEVYVSGEGSWYKREHSQDKLVAAYFSLSSALPSACRSSQEDWACWPGTT